MIVNSEPQTDYLSLIPAVAALVISLLNSYFQFFRKTYKLILNSGEIGFMDINRPVSYSFTVTNAGNTDIFLLDFIFWLKTPNGGSKKGVMPYNNSLWPVLLKPGEIKLFKLSNDINLREKQTEDYYEIDKEWKTYLLELQTTVVLSNGKKQISTLDFATIKFNHENPMMFSGGMGNKILGVNILNNKFSRTTY